LAAAAVPATAAAALGTDHLHPLANDFQLRVLLAVLLPLIELEASFDKDRRAFAEVFAGDFRRPAPERDIDERDLFDPFAGLLVLAAVVDRDADVGDRHAALEVADFHIAGQVAHHNNAVEAGHD
jgi:hypothetical protein